MPLFTIPPAVMQILVETLARSSPELLVAAKMVADFDRKIDMVLTNQALIMEALHVRQTVPALGEPDVERSGQTGNGAAPS